MPSLAALQVLHRFLLFLTSDSVKFLELASQGIEKRKAAISDVRASRNSAPPSTIPSAAPTVALLGGSPTDSSSAVSA